MKKNMFGSAKNIAELYAILLYWEALLYYQLHNGLKGLSIWNVLFMLPLAVLLSVLCGWFKSGKTNGIIKTILLFGISIFYLVDLIYYRIFGSLLSYSMMGNGTLALTSFWWSIKTAISENALTILLFELPVIGELMLVFIGKNDGYGLMMHAVSVLLALVLWTIVVVMLPLGGKQDYTAYGAYHSQYVDTDTASAKLGILPNFLVEIKCSLTGFEKKSDYVATDKVTIEEPVEEEPVEIVRYNTDERIDFSKLEGLSDDDTISSLCGYLKGVTPTKQNEYTGMFKDYNLIYVCAESFSRLAIDKNITPTLYKMANSSIVLDNYYNSFKNVTTNGEYALLTGLWPNVVREATNGGNLTGTMGQSIGKDMSIALGNMFNKNYGVQSRGYHNYIGSYYGRNKTLPNMGFSCKFMDDGMSFTTAWPSSDLEMFEQSVDDYINDGKFCSYYMTFSGHGNYTTDNVMVARNIDEVSKMVNKPLATSALGYLSCNYELEKAMSYLLSRLEEAEILDRTVIVLAGDHYPYYLTDYGYSTLAGEEIDYDFEMYHSTCIIYNAGMEKTVHVDVPCCNVDILPTIMNLFGMDYDSRLYAGVDVFSDGEHIAQIYNRSFITDYVKYNSTNGKATWLKDMESYSEDKLDAYLDNLVNVVKNRYMMSVEIEETDFFRFLFENVR